MRSRDKILENLIKEYPNLKGVILEKKEEVYKYVDGIIKRKDLLISLLKEINNRDISLLKCQEYKEQDDYDCGVNRYPESSCSDRDGPVCSCNYEPPS